MKRVLLAIAGAGLMVFCGVGSLGATLMVDNSIVIDDRGTSSESDDIHWLQDINFTTGMTYDQQIAAIGGLSIGGYTNWHMATYAEVLALYPVYDISEIAGVFTPISDTFPHWTGRYDRIRPSSSELPWHSYHYEMGFAYDSVNDSWSGGIGSSVHDLAALSGLGAWVVGDVAPVPEPTTMLLFGTGIAGLVGTRLRRKKK